MIIFSSKNLVKCMLLLYRYFWSIAEKAWVFDVNSRGLFMYSLYTFILSSFISKGFLLLEIFFPLNWEFVACSQIILLKNCHYYRSQDIFHQLILPKFLYKVFFQSGKYHFLSSNYPKRISLSYLCKITLCNVCYLKPPQLRLHVFCNRSFLIPANVC